MSSLPPYFAIPSAPLHSTEMVDIATSSTAVTAASPRPSIISSIAVMADSDPAQVSSTEMVNTTQLSSAEMADVIPTVSSVMIDKTPELAEKAETSTLLSSSAEMVASTSQLTKLTTHSSEREVQAMPKSHYISAVREYCAALLHDIKQEHYRFTEEEKSSLS